MLAHILGSTPNWVFIVFFVLLGYGFIQSKTRALRPPQVVVLPVIMITLSIGGVLSSFGMQVAPILAWALGLAAALGMNRRFRAPRGVSFNPTARRFHVPGSWTPLGLMMAIFVAKYVNGATTAIQPGIVQTPMFVGTLSFIFGLLSGTFFARFLVIWGSRAGAPSCAPPAESKAQAA